MNIKTSIDCEKMIFNLINEFSKLEKKVDSMNEFMEAQNYINSASIANLSSNQEIFRKDLLALECSFGGVSEKFKDIFKTIAEMRDENGQ